jgi:hypothetical protein
MEEFSPAWFDASSAAWMANKRRVGGHSGGTYIYVCEHIRSNGKPCRRPVAGDGSSTLCKSHMIHAGK